MVLEYTQDVSKNRPGGRKSKKVKPKKATAYENRVNPAKCLVRLYQKYMSLRPDCDLDAFYLRPLDKPKPEVWFAAAPVGKHPLSQVVARTMKDAGIQGYFTNHSLRSTAISRMFDAHLDEKQVKERSGHRSKAVYGYRRLRESHLKDVSNVLYGNDPADSTKLLELKQPEPLEPSHENVLPVSETGDVSGARSADEVLSPVVTTSVVETPNVTNTTITSLTETAHLSEAKLADVSTSPVVATSVVQTPHVSKVTSSTETAAKAITLNLTLNFSGQTGGI